MLLTEDANNPAVYIHDDGHVLLAFRDLNLTNFIAVAERYDGRYEFISGNITPGVRFEDPTLFFHNGLYNMVVEDNQGQLTGDVRHGAHLISADGRTWQPYSPVKVYTHTVEWADGTFTTFDRRERPELVNLGNPPRKKFDGEPTHLVTGVQMGQQSWCIIQAIGK